MARHPIWLVAFVFLASPASTADVTIQLDAGGGLSVRNSTGAIERLRVDEATGNISRNGALFVHTTGTQSVFVGDRAGGTNIMEIAHSNSGFGYAALLSDTSGQRNSAFGRFAMFFNTTGSSNSAVGTDALSTNTSGLANSAFGADALHQNSTGSFNSAFGWAALAHSTGSNNSAFGTKALYMNTTGTNNSAFGASAMMVNTTGNTNAAFGLRALYSNTTGSYNSAFGEETLSNNSTGRYNSAFGRAALFANTTGFFNTGVGQYALLNNSSGGFNSALGQKALDLNTTGSSNTALGQGSLLYNTSGNSNVAVGRYAGISQTTGSNNIYLANFGAAAENGFIRIGTVGTHVRAFIAGIHGIAIPSGSQVFVNANGLLGTTSVSSARFKEDVRDMGDTSDLLMRLRPVKFRYREDAVADPADAKITQYGLIAEEVAEVAPELVAPDLEGRPHSVMYHELPALLLNEVQAQRRTIATLEARIAELEKRPPYTEPRQVAR